MGLRGGGKRARAVSRDVKDLEELNMLIACPPKINDNDLPQVKAALSLVPGSVLAWLETLEIPTLEEMEREILERPRTGNVEFICNSYVAYSIEMKNIDHQRTRMNLAENWARIVFRKSYIESLKDQNGIIQHQRFYGHIVKTIAHKRSTADVPMRDKAAE